jgi:hypothetical protein
MNTTIQYKRKKEIELFDASAWRNKNDFIKQITDSLSVDHVLAKHCARLQQREEQNVGKEHNYIMSEKFDQREMLSARENDKLARRSSRLSFRPEQRKRISDVLKDVASEKRLTHDNDLLTAFGSFDSEADTSLIRLY